MDYLSCTGGITLPQAERVEILDSRGEILLGAAAWAVICVAVVLALAVPL